MRTILLAATASLCLLAGCNRGGANNAAAANAPAPSAPAPNAAAPAETPAPAAADSRSARDIADCVSGAPENLPAGTDANAFCTCAVGKMGTGTAQNDAIRQCAAEMNITLPDRD